MNITNPVDEPHVYTVIKLGHAGNRKSAATSSIFRNQTLKNSTKKKKKKEFFFKEKQIHQ